MLNEQRLVRNFLFNGMTQAEQALDGQDPARMAEALRSILQGAYQLHGRKLDTPRPALPHETLAGSSAEPDLSAR